MELQGNQDMKLISNPSRAVGQTKKVEQGGRIVIKGGNLHPGEARWFLRTRGYKIASPGLRLPWVQSLWSRMFLAQTPSLEMDYSEALKRTVSAVGLLGFKACPSAC